MAELPESGPPDSSPPAPRSDQPVPAPRSLPTAFTRVSTPPGALVALGAGSLALLALGVALADRLGAALYARHRPQLERQLGAVLGHRLELGPYQGIGWSGLRVGPSRVLPRADDPSSLAVSRLGLSLDPLSSLRRRLPVLDLSLDGLELDLRRNRAGGYWQFGRSTPGQAPTRFDLRLRFGPAARLRIPDLGLNLPFRGHGSVQPHRQTLVGGLSFGDPSAGAAPLQLVGGGSWSEGRWRGSLLSRRFDLAQLARSLSLPGQLTGRADGRLQLAWQRGRPDCRGVLQLGGVRWRSAADQAAVELAAPRLQCRGAAVSLPATAWRWGDLAGNVALRAGWGERSLAVEALELRRGDSWLQARGRVGNQLDLSGSWRLQPRDLLRSDALPARLLGGPVAGDLSLQGSWRRPTITSRLGQAAHPLLESWRARLVWSDDELLLTDFTSPHLLARGRLPLAQGAGRRWRVGDLQLQAELQAYPLQRLGPLFGTQLGGQLSAQGTVRGPLAALSPAFLLQIDQPRAGPLQLAERWQGSWRGEPAGGGRLLMRPSGRDGLLQARLDRLWVPVAISLDREGGRLQLEGSPRAYRWQARAFPLAGLRLALGPRGLLQSLQGSLAGSGVLELQPLAFRGRVELERPGVLGVTARQVRLEGAYADRGYRARGDVALLDGGTLTIDWTGRWRGGYRARIRGEALSDSLVRQLLAAWPRWRGRPAVAAGRADDLGALLIDTLGASIDAQLAALNRAQAAVALGRRRQLENLPTAERLDRLAARFNLDAGFSGPRLLDSRVDLTMVGHLWLPGQDRDVALTADPLRMSLQGPVRLGGGQLSLSGVPLALLALLTPVPAELRGALSAQVRYRLGATPELAIDLALQEAGLADTPLNLDRGRVNLRGDGLELDLALRAAEAGGSIELMGRVPLDPAQDGVELRLSSRDDGLLFLSRLAGPAVSWKDGRADLQLLVRGSLQRPIANGFLRVQNGALDLAGQPVQELQATVLFDFEQLILQEFSARVAARGRLSGSGSLGLVAPDLTSEGKPAQLTFQVADVPIRFPRIRAVSNGDLVVGGSLAGLTVSGELALAKGSINVQPARLEAESGDRQTSTTRVAELAEQRWAFQQPLVLFGAEVESRTSEQLRALIPNLNRVRFEDLRLRLGPDLAVAVPGLANFQAEGNLRIEGPFDPTITARGVVRLRQGRLGLFTTTFTLDPGAPNVAVFTPSMGLVPYLDITLRTRVSDSLAVGGVYSEASGGVAPLSPSVAQLESQGAFSSLNQLNLVQVYLSVSGPADRLADNIALRSSPPLPQQRLLALIGGNSLAGVVGSGAGAALATVVGQSLLSPILGTLGDAFGQRLSLAIYPAYVNQAVTRPSEQRSQRVPPQLVVATELGVDITDRLSASVLAAPNVDNVPPQLNLTFKASELINLQGSVDTEGAWQTQLQVFFRF
jgi:translocation and assembly module TamB